jgi:hypothetical protein
LTVGLDEPPHEAHCTAPIPPYSTDFFCCLGLCISLDHFVAWNILTSLQSIYKLFPCSPIVFQWQQPKRLLSIDSRFWQTSSWSTLYHSNPSLLHRFLLLPGFVYLVWTTLFPGTFSLLCKAITSCSHVPL